MIKTFHDKHTQALFRLEACHRKWKAFERVALRKLMMVHAAQHLHDLNCPPGNKLEALHGDRSGQHSIRINGQYRICFEWNAGHAYNVEIVDYH